eukprot:TRINITY_DN31658_c0_g1_i1.p1 TRINITY_DN31658_c0_g1~~TRINITY_DN31658_c0_g1_i1.p1  ORF type:complete len:159 (-),score=6.06 TRINITY_DN31658_c0_g1_i1:102-578(-)
MHGWYVEGVRFSYPSFSEFCVKSYTRCPRWQSLCSLTQTVFSGIWKVDNETCNSNTCCCMHDYFKVNSSLIYEVNVVGDCESSNTASGTLQLLSPGLASMTWFDQKLYVINANDTISFKSFTNQSLGSCLPGSIHCQSGACFRYPIGVVIGFVVMIIF